MAGNPTASDDLTERIAAVREILAGLYSAQGNKKGRGSVNVGEVNVAWSSYEQLQNVIDKYEYRLNRMKSPGSMVIR